MHDGEDFDEVRLRSIDHSVGKTRQLTFMDIINDLWIQPGAAENSMEGIFKDVEKSLL
jgi:hypothetical protein